jgi:hypothetical protein
MEDIFNYINSSPQQIKSAAHSKLKIIKEEKRPPKSQEHPIKVSKHLKIIINEEVNKFKTHIQKESVHSSSVKKIKPKFTKEWLNQFK